MGPGPEPTLDSSGCHSGLFLSPPVSCSSPLACTPTPPALHLSNSYSFIHSFIHSTFTELSEGGRGQSYEQDRHGSSSCGVEHPAGKTDTCGLWSLAAWIHTSQSGSFVSVTLHAEPLPGLSFLLCRMGIVIVASS